MGKETDRELQGIDTGEPSRVRSDFYNVPISGGTEAFGGGSGGSGGGYAARSVHESIPYGSESGGVGDFFKNLFSRKKSRSVADILFEPGSYDEEEDDTSTGDTSDISDTTDDSDSDVKELITDEEGTAADEKRPRRLRDLAYMDSNGMSDVLEDIGHSGELAGVPDLGTAHDDLKAKSEAILSDSKAFGREDSKEMREVKNSIRKLLGSLERDVPSGSGKSAYPTFMVSLKRIDTEYDYVIQACYAYIEHIEAGKGARHSGGKRRLGLVNDVVEQYKREKIAFVPTARRMFFEANGGSVGKWSDVLRNIRMERVSLSDAGVSAVGDGASLLFKRTKKNGGTDFVKTEERTAAVSQGEDEVSAFLSETGGKVAFLPLYNAMKDYYENIYVPFLSGEADTPVPFDLVFEKICREMVAYPDYEYRDKEGNFREVSFADFVPKEEPYFSIMENCVLNSQALMTQWAGMHAMISKKGNESEAAANFAGIQGGSVISDRNESTSRVADRLGVSGLVASSKTTILDHGQGVVTRANVMEGAKGKSMQDLETEAKTYYDETKIQVNISYRSSSLMQMFMLQILDLITGQVDRHRRNYFVTVTKVQTGTNPPAETWYIDSIQGIDNDLSFGTNDYRTMAGGGHFQVPLLDQSGRILEAFAEGDGFSSDKLEALGLTGETTLLGMPTVHYLPRSFYENLVAYKPEIAILDQIDIRSHEELKALADRITHVVKQIEALVTANVIHIIDDGDLESDEGKVAYAKALETEYSRSVGLYRDNATRPKTASMSAPKGVIGDYVRPFKQ